MRFIYTGDWPTDILVADLCRAFRPDIPERAHHLFRFEADARKRPGFVYVRLRVWCCGKLAPDEGDHIIVRRRDRRRNLPRGLRLVRQRLPLSRISWGNRRLTEAAGSVQQLP